MSYKPTDQKTLGLHYDQNSIRAAYVCEQKGQLVIQHCVEISLKQEGEHVKPLYIEIEEKEFDQLVKNSLLISALRGSDVLIRRLKLKLTKEKDIEEAFHFQVEPLLPYPLEQAVVDKLVAEQQSGITLITFLAAKKMYIQNHLDFFHSLQIDPEVVSTEAIALNALAQNFTDKFMAQFIVNVERYATTCLLLKEGKLLSSHQFSIGWQLLHNAVEEDLLKSISQEDFFDLEIKNKELAKFQKALQTLTQTIQWNYLAQIKETKLKETPILLITGEGANLSGFIDELSEILGLSYQPFKMNIAKEKFNAFAIPIGLALTGHSKFYAPINFRQQEFSFSTPWKRFKKPLAIYAAFSILLAISLYFFGISYVQHEEDLIKERYLSLLSLTQKPYDEFEKLYEQKNPFEQPIEGHLALGQLNTEDLERRLYFLEKEIKALPDTFPLLPNTPKVSEVLAWLSKHPTLQCENEGCEPFIIENFNYALVKRPELNKKNEKYQVKIDLEFNTSSPRIAREFHDALISPNDFVDPKGEIKWNATKGKYRTSFFLRDKTYYPQPLKQ